MHTQHSIGVFPSNTMITEKRPGGARHRIYSLVIHRTVSPHSTSFSPEAWRSHRLGNEGDNDEFPMAGFMDIVTDAQTEGCVENFSVDEVSGRVLLWLSRTTGTALSPFIRVFETVGGVSA